MSATLKTVRGQPSWHLATDAVEAFVTETGGHLGPVSFRLGEQTVQPYHVAPWAEDAPADLPPMLRALRGDFFCLPFGGNAEPFQGERHPPHGETANAAWTLDGLGRRGDETTLRLHLETRIRAGRVDKAVSLVDGHTALYQSHTVSGMTGPMSVGHHAMLRFPPGDGTGLVATSPFVWAQTSPVRVEEPAMRGYSGLAVGAEFKALDAVPTADGTTADLSRYPARRGFEDLVMLAAAPDATQAWTAVTFPGEGFVWFTLKDPRVLRQTIMWLSNGGRHYPPWSGRHVDVLGLEEVTSYFHFGLSESAASNPLSDRGTATAVFLDGAPLRVACIAAVAAVPVGFDHVDRIVSHPNDDVVSLISRSGKSVTVPLRHSFLRG